MAWVASARPSSNRSSTASRAVPAATAEEGERAFIWKVYRWMSLGLGVTGIVSLLVASSPAMQAIIFGTRGVFFGLLICELIMVVAFAPVAARVSAGTAALMFFGYAALNGATLSVIFLVYTASSVAATFFVTAGTFGAVAAWGAVTKRNLSSLGSFCGMGLVGIVLAMVVNIFLGSPAITWLITMAGVLVFTGLAAYDTNKLRLLYEEGAGTEAETKTALGGALVLYLDFVNLLLMLLRLLGDRRRD